MPNDQTRKRKFKRKNSFDPALRHQARQYALQAMYQWQIAGTALTDIEYNFLKRYADQSFDRDYFKKLINEIPQHCDEIDRIILPHLTRPLDEIDPIELATLRLATYELLKCPEIPFRVAINEALQLVKQFGSIEGYRFINGVLDQIAKKNIFHE